MYSFLSIMAKESYAMTYGSLLFLLFTVCIASIAGYRRLASIWQLVDVPNSRSSHHSPTLRGGGIIFLPLLCVAWLYSLESISPCLYLGIILAAITGFADDIRGLSAGVRALGYLAALSLAVYGLGFSLTLLPIWAWILWVVVGTGVINAWNFMDGINGITVLYTSVVTFSLWYAFYLAGIPGYTPLFLALTTGLCGSAWMNLRARAIAFLGDVGSVFLGIVFVLLLTLLIVTTGEAGYIIFVLLYGLDTVLTIVERLLRKENIFKAHRTHLYQYLANEQKWPHLRVSLLYSSIQALINILVLWYIYEGNMIGILHTALVVVISGLLYLVIKRQIKSRIRKSI
jgi:UDP-N-acetylmuramyl pentapeptide phosphotransferase/UDP-N-acetylglucosamine-1-phosphate transferase